jgi:hypothetical protein
VQLAQQLMPLRTRSARLPGGPDALRSASTVLAPRRMPCGRLRPTA